MEISRVPRALATIAYAGALTTVASPQSLRPPATPLVAHDPYFSIWSTSDTATESDTVHWTKARQGLYGVAWIDGKPYRYLGKGSAPALTQTGLKVTPTQTIYSFEGGNVKVGLTFLTPALPDNLDVLSRPITYVILSAQATDRKVHSVKFEFRASGEIASSDGKQASNHLQSTLGKLSVLKLGTVSQQVLGSQGDSVRIDWGRLLLSAPDDVLDKALVAGLDGSPAPKVASANSIEAKLLFKPMRVTNLTSRRWLMIGYDDQYSIQYFKQNLRPYWRRNGDDSDAILLKAAAQFEQLKARCAKFDTEMMGDLRAAGGEKYAQICALAYRQCLAGCKLAADPNGQPLLFPKENTSNGCIATSDVIYPMAPQFLLFGKSLTKAMLVPILDYASSSRWRFPFAPHDLGTYPLANGQVYGGGERTVENQMPVEESANMLILMAANAQLDGDAVFASRYWPTLTKWAEYLRDKGFDPENQLCTDDFLGHLAHNVNLSAKAMLGLASYARLCRLKGDIKAAVSYESISKSYAARWMKEADDGDHYRLTFDRAGTWSQKYNLVWDKILGFGLFPDSVRKKEVAFYRKSIQPYGVPLDSRGNGAKIDWSLWTATLTQNRQDFDAIVDPLYRYVNETPQRVGMGDWYDTSNANHLFMHSRPVVGGAFLQLLYSKPVWSKWADRDTLKLGTWAPIPKPQKVTKVATAGDTQPVAWRFTTQTPSAGWQKGGFDDSGWKSGSSGFGVRNTPGVTVRTVWDTKDIWLRREFTLTAAKLKNLEFWVHHDDAAEIYINGVLAGKFTGWTSQYETRSITPEGRKALKAGKNVIAIHCHQDAGGQYIDLGFVTVEPG